MCRWAAYHGPSIYLEDVVTAPCHSLIAQSHHALEAKTATNGDGFGIAWYGERDEPGLYCDILPAWSDTNLKSICRQVRSHLFLAHVRAATGGQTSRVNCHPFVAGRWSFMHNGQVGFFERLRRPLESTLCDETYGRRHGTTDSELVFLMMLDEGLDNDPQGATERALARIASVSRNCGIEPFIRFTASFTDGQRLYAVRYATDAYAPTLYSARLTQTDGYCLVSEPLDGKDSHWGAVAPDSFVEIGAQGINVRRFAPQPATRPAAIA